MPSLFLHLFWKNFLTFCRNEDASLVGSAFSNIRSAQFFSEKLYRHDNATFCNRLGHWWRHCVAKLPVCLGVGNRNFEMRTPPAVKAHESGAFPRGEPPWVAPAALDENLGAIFVVSSRERSGPVLRANKAIAKAIAFGAVLGFCMPLGKPRFGR